MTEIEKGPWQELKESMERMHQENADELFKKIKDKIEELEKDSLTK